MKPSKQTKITSMLLFVLAASFLSASNDSIVQVLQKNQRQFVVTQHHFSAGASWIAYRPLQFTSMKGPVKIKSQVGHSYKFDAGYTYWHNNYFGVYLGAGVGKVCYVLNYTLDKSKYVFPYNEEDFVFQENFRDLFFYIPILVKGNLPIKNKSSVFIETGLTLTHHPRSIYEFEVLFSDNSYNYISTAKGIFYRNAHGNPIYIDIPLNIGTLIKLPYADFVSIKAQLNFSPQDIVNGQVELYNIGAGNDTQATFKMNTSYFGIEVAYVITGAKPWLKKRGYVFNQHKSKPL
jgi:hypothetical protein